MKLIILINFTSFHNVFYAICILNTEKKSNHCFSSLQKFYELVNCIRNCRLMIRGLVINKFTEDQHKAINAMLCNNPLPNNKMWNMSKSNAFADKKLHVIPMMNRQKHCGKRRKSWLPAFSSFPKMFENNSGLLRIGIVWKQFNPFPNKPCLLHVCSTSLLKTPWEKGQLHVTSNFSFSHSVSYLFGELSTIVIKFKFFVSKLFQFGRV